MRFESLSEITIALAAILAALVLSLAACTEPSGCPEPPDMEWKPDLERCVDRLTGKMIATECCEHYLPGWGEGER